MVSHVLIVWLNANSGQPSERLVGPFLSLFDLGIEPGAEPSGWGLLCVWLTEAHPNLISYKQSFLEDGGMLFIIMTLAEAVPLDIFEKEKQGIERRILSHGQMPRTTDPHTARVQRNLTA